MGVGIFGHRLAGTVAKHGAVGTVASVDLRRLHPDIMNRLRKCKDTASHSAANVEALDRELRAARCARARRPGRLHRCERHARPVKLRRLGRPGLQERRKRHCLGRRTAVRSAGSHGTLSKRGADPNSVGRAGRAALYNRFVAKGSGTQKESTQISNKPFRSDRFLRAKWNTRG
jgi:NAD(P)H-dependent flavin oxidoreductase YrpB (nitropropane dioxygenase family)